MQLAWILPKAGSSQISATLPLGMSCPANLVTSHASSEFIAIQESRKCMQRKFLSKGGIFRLARRPEGAESTVEYVLDNRNHRPLVAARLRGGGLVFNVKPPQKTGTPHGRLWSFICGTGAEVAAHLDANYRDPVHGMAFAIYSRGRPQRHVPQAQEGPAQGRETC